MLKSLEQVLGNYKQLFSSFKKLDFNKIAFWLVIVAVVYYIIVFSLYTILLQEVFWTQAFDSGIDDQGIWLLSRFMNPFVTVRGLNLFGDSITFYHVFIAPFFWLWNNINVLYIIQTIFIALGAIPLFLFARERLNSPFLAVVVALSFLLYPALQNLNLDQYHSEAITVFFMILTLFFLLKKNFPLFYVFLLISLLGKDEVAATGVFIGLFLIIFKKEFRHGSAALAISGIWFLLCSKLLTPFFNGISFFAPQPLTYSHWFRGLMSNLFNFNFYWHNIFHWESLVYYFHLFVPLALIPLLGGSILFLLIPSIAVNVLSGTGYLRSVFYHYNYVQSAIIFFALIEGFYFLKNKNYSIRIINREKIFLLGSIVLIFALISNAMLSNFPLYKQWAMLKEKIVYLNSSEVQIKKEALKFIPAQAKVSASYSFVPQLSHREEIYMFPNPFIPALWGQWFQEGEGIPPAKGHVDFIIVDLGNLGKEDRFLLDYLTDEGFFKIIFEQSSVVVAEKTSKWNTFDYSREKFNSEKKNYRKKLQNRKKKTVGANLLENPGFEQEYGNVPQIWELVEWQEEDANCSFSLEPKVRKKGKNSVKLAHDGLADSRWTQKLFLKPSTYYKLSGWIKTDNVQNNGAGAYIQIDGVNKKTKELFGTNDWQYVEIEFKTMLAQDEVTVLCRLGNFGAPNGGTAYFDEIELKELL